MLPFIRKNYKGYRPTLFEILIGFIFVSIVLSVFFLLFRTKKELIIVVKASEDCRVINNCYTWPQSDSAIWFSNLFQAGMIEKDSLGKPMAEVINVRKYDDRPGNSVVYLTLKLKSLYSPRNKLYTYKGSNVLVGSSIKLVLDGVFLEALVVNMEGIEDRYPTKKLRLSVEILDNNAVFTDTQGVRQFVADSVLIGDTIEDSSGKTVLKIVDKVVEDADQVVKTAGGDVLLRKNPQLKDVSLTLEVTAYETQGRYYFFDDIPLIVNGKIPIHFKNISIFPIITKIEEIR